MSTELVASREEIARGPLVIHAIARLNRQLGCRHVAWGDTQDFEHGVGCADGVGDEVLETDDERLDLIHGEPSVPTGVVRGSLARERVDLLSVVDGTDGLFAAVPVVPAAGLDCLRT